MDYFFHVSVNIPQVHSFEYCICSRRMELLGLKQQQQQKQCLVLQLLLVVKQRLVLENFTANMVFQQLHFQCFLMLLELFFWHTFKFTRDKWVRQPCSVTS